ncbi:MAG: transcriptional regulator [Gammaproteobacteria bacterium]|nr:MAG: transcriptional regulator [Gammaproteobacteria bacterium]
MPIYEYVCKSCGHQRDVLQKMSDAPLTLCPECGEESFSKKISAAGFRLKGSGWYETDFKTGNKKNLAGNDDPAGGQKSETSDKTTPAKATDSGSSGNSSSGSENKTTAA